MAITKIFYGNHQFLFVCAKNIGELHLKEQRRAACSASPEQRGAAAPAPGGPEQRLEQQGAAAPADLNSAWNCGGGGQGQGRRGTATAAGGAPAPARATAGVEGNGGGEGDWRGQRGSVGAGSVTLRPYVLAAEGRRGRAAAAAAAAERRRAAGRRGNPIGATRRSSLGATDSFLFFNHVPAASVSRLLFADDSLILRES